MDYTTDTTFRLVWEGLDYATVAVTSWAVRDHYLGVSATWEADIVLQPEDQRKPRDLLMAPVILKLDGSVLLQGRCEWVESGETPYAMRVGGRDYLADLIECDTDPALIVTEADTLQSAILKACGPIGITSMVADGGFALRTLRCGQPIGRKKTQIAPGEVKMQDMKPAPGRRLSDWVGHLAARHGLTIQPGTERSQIQLHAPDYTQPAFGRIRRSQSSNSGNIVSATARRDGTRVPTCVVMTNQAGATSEVREAGIKVSNVVDVASNWIKETTGITTYGQGARRKPGSSSTMPDGGFYRLIYHQDKEARNADMLVRDATRTVADRLKDTLQYNVTLKGVQLEEEGPFFAPDTIIQVDDDIADVHEPLWVANRSMSNGPGGPKTSLQLWRPGSFQIS